jgi:hypothetical protein
VVYHVMARGEGGCLGPTDTHWRRGC